MEIEQRNVLNKWTEYTLTNDHGISISLLNYGATITKWLAPDQNGNLKNIVLVMMITKCMKRTHYF
ncbi:hypothetical protein [Piscibacillus salipiscarius]|uniref:aldose epimerase family protein n=1 Tax=Piscibacillus salipiscarius TaxID=299480 RepID=UPI0006D09C93